ncbi:hypothetical protein D779_2133 [Imhoffiella purpurea]|uniref:HTH cro/C1-type domain-containing protein n=2 Tax=Imhoffiella purpurea TaxID=1249627 RepID=W9V5W8_9GAMM|nr:hypothetical protein D779_2133 [Imhoffiella purpurea]
MGISQAALAKLVGISQPYYGQIEIGEKVPSADVLQKLAAATDTSVGWLLDNIEDPASADYNTDQRVAVLNDLRAAPGLRALAEDEPMCHVLEISNAEWKGLKSIALSVQPDKDGYLLLLQTIRHIERLASVKGAGRPRKERD